MRRPIYREAQSRLKEYIRERALGPGDRLPPEGVLATQLAVSRLSLREAIRSLQTLGVVEARPGTGLFVSPLSFRPILDQLPYGLADTVTQLGELLVAREALEVGLMPFVARQPAGVELRECERLASAMADPDLDGAAHVALDRQFHRTLYLGLRNTLVDHIIEIFWDLFAKLEHPDPWLADPNASGVHLDIVRALRAADGRQAAAAMHRHFGAAWERCGRQGPGNRTVDDTKLDQKETE